MGKTVKEKKRKIIRGALIAVAVVFLVVAILLLLRNWEEQQGAFPEQEVAQLTQRHNGADYALKENVETFLIMGLDKFEGETQESYNNDRQADFLLLLVFDNSLKKCTALHINRDTVTDISVLGVAGNKIDTVKKQIALAHTYGNGKDVSCRNTADAVSALLLDSKINHYVSLTMDSVAVLNDAVGGVEVEVLDDFSGIDDTLVKGQKVTLMGEHALNYVRTRYGLEDSTNNTRMKRQKQYLEALQKKAVECADADDEFVVEALVKMSDYIVSDRSVTQLQDLAEKFTEYEFTEIVSLEGDTKEGKEFMEFYPTEASIKQTVIDLFYEVKK